MKYNRFFWLVVLALALAPLACNMPATLGNVNLETQVAATVNAGFTATAAAQQGLPSPQADAPSRTPEPGVTRTPQPQDTYTPLATYTSLPTYTPLPSQTPLPSATFTPLPSATLTPIPCNWAQFVSDVSYPDGSDVQTGEGFVKTWRLKNLGSCTWTPAYHLVFSNGDSMNAPASVSMTNVNVPPGGTADVSVSLKAPAAEGTYKGYFKLRAPDGTLFGIGAAAGGSFWVEIEAIAPAPEPAKKPDLYVSQFVMDPNPPQADQPVEVKVTVYNGGNAKAGAYKVEWYGTKNFPAPSCSWDVAGNNAKGGKVLSCTFTFVSPYHQVTTKVVVDAGDAVDESDEGNNVFTKKIDVD